MAKTNFATNDALVKKTWEEKLYRDTVRDSYFNRFFGQDSSSLVHVKTQLEKSQGDKITFGLRMRLQAEGVTEGQMLEGNEEKLQVYDYALSLSQYRHAVRDAGAMARKRAMFSIDDESRMALKEWGSEKIDKLCFSALLDTPTKTIYRTAAGLQSTSTPATAKAALTAADSKITPALISALKALAQTGGDVNGTRAFIPIRPVRVDGSEYYVLLAHPDVIYDMKQDATFQTAWRDAQERGKNNPLFKDAAIVWDGVVVHSHPLMTAGTDAGAGSNVPFSRAVFMGAQALTWAWGQRESIVMKEFDYDNEHGYAWGMIAAVGKPKFNSVDFGSISVYLARTNIAGL